MNKVAIYLFLLIGALISFNNQASEQNDLSAGMTSLDIVSGQSLTFHSEVLNEQRSIQVALPDNYAINATKRYPVLFTLDGETHFKHITGTVDWLSNHAMRIPQMIVVAIDNTQRGRDMSPSYNKGGSDNFIRFIETEVVPYIDSHYRTQPFRILAGHSMAGHLALNMYNQSPDAFNAIITMSPFFRMDRGEVRLVDKLKQQLRSKNQGSTFIYSSIGDEPTLKPLYDEFVSLLDNTEQEVVRWRSFESDNDTHMSIPSNSINNALRFIFEPMKLAPSSDIAQQGIASITTYYKDISDTLYHYPVSPEDAIIQRGFHLLIQKKRAVDAIDMFRTNTELFPDSAEAFFSLSEGYRRNNQHDKALNAINKAVTLAEANNYERLAFFKRRKGRIEQRLKEQVEG